MRIAFALCYVECIACRLQLGSSKMLRKTTVRPRADYRHRPPPLRLAGGSWRRYVDRRRSCEWFLRVFALLRDSMGTVSVNVRMTVTSRLFARNSNLVLWQIKMKWHRLKRVQGPEKKKSILGQLVRSARSPGTPQTVV